MNTKTKRFKLIMKLTNLLRFLITEDVHYDIQTFI